MGLLDNLTQLGTELRQAVHNLAQSPGGQPRSQPGTYQGQPASPVAFPLADESVNVTLDGTGKGTVRWSPGQVAAGSSGGVGIGRNSGYNVDVTGVSVNVQPAPGNPAIINQAQASTYLSYGIQSAGPGDFQGQTPTGSTGDTCTLASNMRPGDWITTVWTGGDAGALATMKIIGTVNPQGA
jgi:hypothetical protein